MPFTIRPFRRFPVQRSVTYNAGLWSLITLLVLNSGPAYAEWVLVSVNNETGMTAYVDPATIRREGDLVKTWTLFDFKTIQTLGGSSLLSSKMHSEFDCAAERQRQLAFLDYSGHMGRGQVVSSDSYNGEWEPVAPDSMGRTMWEFVCRKQ